jgi:hypothetical protein
MGGLRPVSHGNSYIGETGGHASPGQYEYFTQEAKRLKLEVKNKKE